MTVSVPPVTAERYHALDAFRASAMLLGIIFHAAWMYSPLPGISPPIIDASGNYVFSYIVYMTHIFRMSGFFLIAGFFAHLVLDRRGTATFVRQRLKRIALPFVVGWAILWPAFFIAYQYGAMETGTYFAPVSPWKLLLGIHLDWQVFLRAYGLTHLWFLNVLLWLSVATLILVWVWRRCVDRPGHLTTKLTDWLAGWMRTPLVIPLLALVSTPPLYFSQWFGITTPLKIVPLWPSFLAYWIYFLVGWLFYARLDLLREFDRRWKLHLILGTAVSIALFLFYKENANAGRLTDPQRYPVLAGNEIQQWPSFRARLVQAGSEETASVARNVWLAMPPSARDFTTTNETVTPHQQNALARILNSRVLASTNLTAGVALDTSSLPPDLVALLDQPEAERDPFLLNRKWMEWAFPGAIMPSDLDLPEVRWRKAGYSLAYAVSAWCLIFGSLGFFRRCFSHPSAAWRYAADSSYWLYLVHLPIMFAIEISMASLDWPAWIKFPMLLLVAMLIMLPSYHYLVRSTFIGAVLNGARKGKGHGGG